MSRPPAFLASRQRLRVAGVMSGTSCDGITTAVIDVSRRSGGLRARFRSLREQSYPAAIRPRLLDAARLALGELATLDVELGRSFGRALRRHLGAEGIRRVDLVGSHGHTVFHRSRADRSGPAASWQIGKAAEIALAAGCPVVYDFRAADITAGGEGAPLVPFADAILFSPPRGRPRVCLNIGGIANVTLLDGTGRPRLALDTGPGATLIDAAARHASRGRRRMDRDGALAGRGRVESRLLERLLAHPFFERRPPRSAARETFDALLARALRARLSPADVLSTLTELTVESIARAVEALPLAPADLVAAGGGTRNRELMRRLEARLAPLPVRRSDELGWPAAAREAAAFALLAAAFVWRLRASFPETTGRRGTPILGALCLPPVDA